MFTQGCFIRKNTNELQDELLKLSLKKNPLDDFKGNCLVVNYGMFMSQYRLNELNEEDIDCGENEDLFLAIAALRDDSNEHQWFVWDDDDEGDKWKLYDNDSNWSWWIFECHKATVEELIEHFKNSQ